MVRVRLRMRVRVRLKVRVRVRVRMRVRVRVRLKVRVKVRVSRPRVLTRRSDRRYQTLVLERKKKRSKVKGPSTRTMR
jgi:hypothetical protein